MFQSNFQQPKLGLNKKQWNRGEERRLLKTLLVALWRILVGWSWSDMTYQPSAVFGDALNKCFVSCIGHIHSSLLQWFIFFNII